MNLIEKIKLEQVKSRKERTINRTKILTTLLGEAERVGKDDGNRVTTDDECKNIIKKFVKNINTTLKLSDKNSDTLNFELVVLKEFLPKEMGKTELTEIITNVMAGIENPTIGIIMGKLKSEVKDLDGRLASSIIKGLL